MKITLKQWTEIGKYNGMAKWLQPLCDYRLYKIENNKYKRVQTVSLWLYLLILMPVHIVDLFLCLWDGGLKEFQFQTRPTRFDIIHPDTASWERANKIYMEKGGK